MAKPLLQLAALGIAGVALWKVASFMLIPVLTFVFKIALVVGIVMLAIWFLKKNDKRKDDTSEA